MITVDRIYTDNPLVDNVIYYAKLLALNSVIKDEEEANSYESAESLRNGDLLISCTEGSITYEIIPWVPKEVLEKYISIQSNIDVYANSDVALKTHLNSYSQYQRTILLNKLSSLARTVYIDHYDVMMYYLDNTEDTWLSDHEDLYNRCKSNEATYVDLFNELPSYTVKRIIKTYLNNYDKRYFDAIIFSLDTFQSYIDDRDDTSIETELDYINKAMRAVFISHYDMMIERGYLSEDHMNWLSYISYKDTYTRCKTGNITYIELYPLFPYDDLRWCLLQVINESIIDSYNLDTDISALEDYFTTLSIDPDTEKAELTRIMSDKYMENYNPMINFDIYNKCKDGLLNYFDLSEYLPVETKKVIINTFIDEVSNIEIYEDNKEMLNEYLASIPYEERQAIKDGIVEGMISWYPSHHKELNAYYRALSGVPPLDDKSEPYKDTLLATYDAATKTYVKFGDQFTNMIPPTIYPESHWDKELYEFDNYDIAILRDAGIIDSYIEACKAIPNNNTMRYKYLSFLGDEKIDCYTARKADRFQLLKVPTVDDYEARNRYTDVYAKTRDYILKTVYTDAYKFQSPYYDKFITIFILVNTILGMLTDIPELFINREVFDARCIKYLFESYGIPYYSEIPLKYQRAMVKNLNTLIKYKSSTRNMIDICSIFGFKDVCVFNYYLFKQYYKDPNTGDYLTNENNSIAYDIDLLYVREENGEVVDLDGNHYTKLTEWKFYDESVHLKTVTIQNDDGTTTTKVIMNNDYDFYIEDPADPGEFILFRDLDYFTKIKADIKVADLKFIKVPIGESVLDYKNSDEYIAKYDDIVYQDEGDTWDGGLIHEKLKQDILDYEFNAVRTKYISIETVTEMTEMAFQISYFYNMLFDNIYSEDQLMVEVPQIKRNHKFRFMDIICYLFAMTYIYSGLEDTIMYSPTQILYVKGYNFDKDLNNIINDARYFSQEDEYGPLEDYEKENIFDVNSMILSEGYDYQEAFKYFDIKSFNLLADIDELEKWLNDNYQMSLDDFIVDDTLKDFNQIITLRNFFSLNNSYYQKSIFDGSHLLPLEYNNEIKYAFSYDIYKKINRKDISDYTHTFIEIDGNTYEIIDRNEEEVYIMDYNRYLNYDNEDIAVYYKYLRQDSGDYYNTGTQPYRQNESEYVRIFDDEIFIRDTTGTYIMAKPAFYRKIDGEYVEIVEDRYFYEDPFEPLRKVLLFGEYYIQDENGNWVLDPENCYVIVKHGDETIYVLATDIDAYGRVIISEDDCFIRHSDGHFIRFTETDYYRRTHADDSDSYDEYKFIEEELYIITDEETEYYDATVNPRVYYKKLEDYYRENEYIVITGTYYVMDPEGNFITESNLIHPLNCWFKDADGNYLRAIDYIGTFINYSDDSKFNVDYLLILLENYDYAKVYYSDLYNNYIKTEDENTRYVFDYSDDYAIVLYTNKTYEDTKEMIVIFNKLMDGIDRISEDDDSSTKYDPEVLDKKWDENDWMYNDPSYDEDNSIGMNGENKWYYRKPGDTSEIDDDFEETNIGSGFYLPSYAYIGDIAIEKGETYFMSFDIECNFGSKMQICCEADDSVKSSADRVYDIVPNESYHVTQSFTANDLENPRITFLVYDYDKFPIRKGYHIIVRNFKFMKAYNDNYVATDIPSFDKLLELYRTNSAIYKYLATKMAECSDYDTYMMYKKLYDSLMISKYNKEAFKVGTNTYAKTYTEFLKYRDIILYDRLMSYKDMEEESMKKLIADDIIDITYAIDDYIDVYDYNYLYSYFPAVSANYIQQYIYKIIDFFKSWKVHLLGINTVYKFNDKLENTIKILEDELYKNKIYNKSKVHIQDAVKINPVDSYSPSGDKYTDLYDDLVTITHRYKESVNIVDRVRLISRSANYVVTSEHSDDMHVVFHDINHKVSTDIEEDNAELNINTDRAELYADDNELHMVSNDTNQSLYDAQILDEITHMSKDIVDWRLFEDGKGQDTLSE